MVASERQQNRTLKIEDQTVQTTLKISLTRVLRDSKKVSKCTKVQTVIRVKIITEKSVVIRPGKNLYLRVRSWLRMNAGGVLNTCKSNEEY